MNIKLAWDFDFRCYQSLFPEIELFNWEKDTRKPIDLLVFPGGSDVTLEYYCNRDTVERYKNLCYTDEIRDDSESEILRGCYDGRLTVRKILGVCRGMQFINVMFNGKLFEDLFSYGLEHGRVHDLTHRAKSNLKFLKTVNSLHHQGIRNIGAYNLSGNKSYPVIVATDKSGNVPEIATWDNDRVLGVQFHPEYFHDINPDKAKFREFCYSWVRGETKILD